MRQKTPDMIHTITPLMRRAAPAIRLSNAGSFSSSIIGAAVFAASGTKKAAAS
jgi:hypothetical protein